MMFGRDPSVCTDADAYAERDQAAAREMLAEALRHEFEADLPDLIADALSNAVYRTRIHFAPGIDCDAVMTERDAERELIDWLHGREKK